MQFKIPQNVEIEDKILSFLTMRQLIVLFVWGVIAYIIFYSMTAAGYLPHVWWPIVFFIWAITVAVAFLQINLLPFHRWIVLVFASLFLPKKRTWNNRFFWKIDFDLFTLKVETAKKEEKKEEIFTKQENLEQDRMKFLQSLK